jgi:peptide/nickel transport system substrate-binding protein
MRHFGDQRYWRLVLALALVLGPSLVPGPWAPISLEGLVAGLAEGATRPTGGTVVVGLDQEPFTLDPHASPLASTFQIISSVTESLLYLTPERTLKPWLAESWEASPDSKSFTFRLRKDVTFQDGEPLTAAVVKWNFDRIVDPSFKAGPALTVLADYSGSEVLDDYTVKVQFKKPYAPFLTVAAHSVLSLVSPKAVKARGDNFGQGPVGTGIFAVEEYVSKDHVTLVRNPQYNRTPPWGEHEGPAYLEKIIWRFIPEPGTRVATVETGEAQMVYLIPSQDLPRLEKTKNIRLETMTWAGMPRSMHLNVKKPPTDELAVRQAINYGIDKEALVQTLFKGTGQVAYAPLTLDLLDDPALHAFYPYDIEKAKSLLEQAGWKAADGGGIRVRDGKKLEFLINAADVGGGPWPGAQMLQAQLRELGFDVTIKSQALAPFFEDNYNCRTNGPITFLRFADWGILYYAFHSSVIGSNFNWACYSNPTVDELLERGRQEGDVEKRRQIYLTLEKRLLEEAVTVPLVEDLSVWAMRKTVKGFKYNGWTYPVLGDLYIEK